MSSLWNATQHIKRKLRFYDQERDSGKAFIYFGEYGDLEGLRRCIIERGVSFQDEVTLVVLNVINGALC